MFFRLATIAAVSVCLGSCAVPSKPVVGPDGGTAYSMTCSGFGRTMESCYEEAGRLCPSGYNIDAMGSSGPARQSSMLISCK